MLAEVAIWVQLPDCSSTVRRPFQTPAVYNPWRLRRELRWISTAS